ncbi:MAG: transposase, partial [Gammaproteobacteria bacterium]|nr:transposase [Gammaproteobacteria bacterium]
RHQFKQGKLDFAEPTAEGSARRRRVNAETRLKIRSWREQRLSAAEITELLLGDGVEISVRTVERVLVEEGFPKLPRRTRLKIGRTVQGAEIPEISCLMPPQEWEGQRFDSAAAGVFLFAPFLGQLRLAEVVESAGLPGSKQIPALNYLLSFLALKLLGTERYAQVGEHGFDPGLGLFAGLNVLPKCTAMSSYAYSLDEVHLRRLQEAFIVQAIRMGLYDGSVVNLDFHTVPHFGDESVLERHWAGARSKVVKGALTLFAQDAQTKLLLYTQADIQRAESDEQILEFVAFWAKMWRGVAPTLIFDSRFTTYANLSKLNTAGIKFITLRRRGSRLLESVQHIKQWKRIHIPHGKSKRKYPNPLVHESTVELRGYDGKLRQVIMKNNGREAPTFLISNDTELPVELLVGNYARRWRVENGIAEAVSFFNINSLSSSILIKVHFDVLMTMVADTLYTLLARKLRGFEECDAPKLYRHFVKGKGTIEVHNGNVTVSFPRRAHNPILRAVPWQKLPDSLPASSDLALNLRFN